MKMLVLLNYIQAIVVNIDYIIGYYLFNTPLDTLL